MATENDTEQPSWVPDTDDTATVRDHAINVTITVVVAQLFAIGILGITMQIHPILFLGTGLCIGIGMIYVIAKVIFTEVEKMIQ